MNNLEMRAGALLIEAPCSPALAGQGISILKVRT